VTSVVVYDLSIEWPTRRYLIADFTDCQLNVRDRFVELSVSQLALVFGAVWLRNTNTCQISILSLMGKR